MPHPPRPAGLVPGLALLALWAVWEGLRYWNFWPSDLSALYFAARFFAEGQFAEIYASPARFFGEDTPASWTAAVAAAGHPDAQTFPYIYPPLWAALLSPVTRVLSPTAFFQAVLVWHLALLALAPLLAWRIMRPRLRFAAFAAITAALLATSVLPHHALFQNQPQITLAVLTLLSFERLTSGRQAQAGLALGLAAALKLSPILLLAIFLVERQYRASLVALATAGGLALLSVLVAGWPLHVVFLEKLRLLGDQLVIWDLNLSLRSALFQMWELMNGRRLPASTDDALLLRAPAWLDPAMLALLVAGGAAVWALTRRAAPEIRLRHRLAAGATLITLCGPLAWAHHYLVPLFLLPGLFGPLTRPAATAAVIGFGIVFADATAARLPGLLPLNLTTPISVAGMIAVVALFAASARAMDAPDGGR